MNSTKIPSAERSTERPLKKTENETQNKSKVRKQYPVEVAKCLEDIPQHEKKLNRHLRILQKKLLALQNQHQKVTK